MILRVTLGEHGRPPIVAYGFRTDRLEPGYVVFTGAVEVAPGLLVYAKAEVLPDPPDEAT
jgi:hypothetical protein